MIYSDFHILIYQSTVWAKFRRQNVNWGASNNDFSGPWIIFSPVSTFFVIRECLLFEEYNKVYHKAYTVVPGKKTKIQCRPTLWTHFTSEIK